VADTLNELERRVLGVLLEKSLAQPAYYPMTLNAVVVACNQKNNRDPVMELDEESVWDTLDVLRQKGLVSKVMPGGGARTERYKHEVGTIFGWEKPQRAIMTELLIRGPQTIGELRTHCGRMYVFENLDAVTAVLETLMQRSPPQVAPLPRAAGQSAVRYMHLFYPDKEKPAADAMAATAVATGPAPAAANPPGSNPPTASAPSARSASLGQTGGDRDVESLRSEIDRVRSELAGMQETVAELGRRLEALEQRMQ
jgi:hypothetical protein